MKKSSRTGPALRWRLEIWRRRVLVGTFAPETIYSIDMSDAAIDALEDRVAALEELVAARWPRSMTVRRRLARQLRASDATFAWAGDTFTARRAEAMSEDIHDRTRRPS